MSITWHPGERGESSAGVFVHAIEMGSLTVD